MNVDEAAAAAAAHGFYEYAGLKSNIDVGCEWLQYLFVMWTLNNNRNSLHMMSHELIIII